MKNTAIIIVAAGASSRFGGIKQLALVNNKTLLQHVLDEARESVAHPIIVVTGANNQEITKVLQAEPFELVYNEHWQQGIASSIVAGLKQAMHTNAGLERVIMAVCDQPFVSAQLFQQIYNTQLGTGAAIVACTYAGTVGTPALFTKKHFDELLSLKGDEGAKKIIRSADGVVTVDFPQGAIDIDTPGDYANLQETGHPSFPFTSTGK